MNKKIYTSILIIEDDIDYGNLLEEQLQAYGYLTQLKRTGRDGLISVSLNDFDLVVVENCLPDMTGIDVANELQRLEVPFIMLSGNADPEVVKQTSNSGAHAYLIKPVNPDQLFSTLEAVSRRAKEMKDLRASSARLIFKAIEDREISVAVGILIDHLRVPENEARDRIRKTSRCERRKLSDLAGELVTAADMFYLKLEKYETE